MGRPERTLDPQAGPVQRLAHELRALRRASGSPSYRTMVAAAGFSTASLSRAAAGDRLPSLDVLRAYVSACGADPAEWEPRWKEAAAATAATAREETADTRPPYRGLDRFEPADRDLFFGRDRMIDETVALVRDHRLAVLFGASGSGKSSLLRAGLIPRLQVQAGDRGDQVVLRILTPGARPASRYGHLLAPAEDEPESWVVVDQFEEIFTLCRDREERTRFIDLLLSAREPGSRLRVLIAVRADFYARCLEHRALADALRSAGLGLGPMTAGELRAAVTRPAAATGLLVERDLTTRIVQEVQDEPGGLPMLSHALLETWRRRKGRLLTLAAYEAAGGLHGAIAATAEGAYGKLSGQQELFVRRLLLRMVEPGRGTPDTRRPLTWAELDEWATPEAAAVVDALARARLLTCDEDGVQLAHEALLSCWPRLAGWLEEERERLRHHRRLTEAAQAWAESDRDPGALYRGTRLDRAQEAVASHESMLTTTERAFLTAASQVRDTEHRTAARTARRSRLLFAALSAILVVALAAGLTAWTQHRTNEQQRTDATARRIAAVADSLRTSDPSTAMLLGAAAWQTSPLPETRHALFSALTQPEVDTFSDPGADSGTNVFLTDSGRTLLSVDGRTWHTSDVTTHRRTASGKLPSGAQAVAADHTGRLLALLTDDGIRLWDRSQGHWTGAPDPLPRASTGIAFGAGGRSYLVSDTLTGRVELRSVTDGRLLFQTRASDESHVAASSDDRQVAVCTAGKAPQLWDTLRNHVLRGAWDDLRGLCDESGVRVVFGTGTGDAAHRFAVASATGVRVWDTRTGRQTAVLTAPEVRSAAFSADGAFLATADDTQIEVWRLAAPDAPVLRHALDGQQTDGSLAWDPNRPVLRHLLGATVHSYDTAAATTSAWRTQAAESSLLAPDGHTLVIARRAGTHYGFELRGTREGQATRTLPALPLSPSEDHDQPGAAGSTVPLMAFSPDGGTFAYGISAPARGSQRIVLWDVSRARVLTTLDLTPSSSAEEVVSLALGPGGHILYTARPTADGGVTDEVWDTAGHRRTGTVTGLDSTRLTVGADGRLLVGDHRAARLPAGRALTSRLVQGEHLTALAFTADGSRLAASDLTGRVTVWDGDLHHRVGLLADAFPSAPADSPETVSALALSPDGHTLAVGGDGGTLQLWDTGTWQPLGDPLPTSGEAITSLAFDSASHTLYGSSAHVRLQRYAIDPSQAIRQICARSGRQLTRAQWGTYATGVAYPKMCN